MYVLANLCFWLLELVLLSAAVALLLSVYFMINRTQFSGLTTYGMYSQAANTFVCYVTLFLLIDAVLRIRSLSKSELAISKLQILWHIAAFSIQALAYTLLLVIFIRKEAVGVSGRFDADVELSEELLLIITVLLAELPLIFIINSLV
jgi:hypothetical protein